MSSSFFTSFSNRDPYALKGGDLEFKVAVVDPSFDMTDNPYGEFKLHKYSSIMDYKNIIPEDKNLTRDEIVELRDCDYGKPEDKNSAWNVKQKYYCPVWKDGDFLYGDYYTPKTTWYRLAMHECDAE